MNNIVEPEHAAPTEHAIPPPLPANSIDMDQLLEDHKLLNRLSQYPLVKSVCEQTSGIFTKAKQMSPQVVSNGLDKAQATIAEVINKPAPVNLAPVEDFGCRQLDALDSALESPIGKSIQTISSKVVQAGVGLVNKTPLRSLTSSSDPSSSAQINKSNESNPQNLSVTQRLYSDIKEKGVVTTLQTNLTSGSDMILARVEDYFALEHDPHLRSQNQLQNIPNKKERSHQHDIHLPEESDPLLMDRTVNLAANGVYQVAKRVDNLIGHKLTDQTKMRIGRAVTDIQSMIVTTFQLFFLLILSLPFIRRHQEYISSKMGMAQEYYSDVQEIFITALHNAEKKDMDSKDQKNNNDSNKSDNADKNEQLEDSKDEDLERDNADVGQSEKPKSNKKKKGSATQKAKK